MTLAINELFLPMRLKVKRSHVVKRFMSAEGQRKLYSADFQQADDSRPDAEPFYVFFVCLFVCFGNKEK